MSGVIYAVRLFFSKIAVKLFWRPKPERSADGRLYMRNAAGSVVNMEKETKRKIKELVRKLKRGEPITPTELLLLQKVCILIKEKQQCNTVMKGQ